MMREKCKIGYILDDSNVFRNKMATELTASHEVTFINFN